MSLLLLFNQPSPAEAPRVPILPEDDPRAKQPLVWAPLLTQRLIRLLKEERTWDRVDPRALEEIVAELFDGFGYQVEPAACGARYATPGNLISSAMVMMSAALAPRPCTRIIAARARSSGSPAWRTG